MDTLLSNIDKKINPLVDKKEAIKLQWRKTRTIEGIVGITEDQYRATLRSLEIKIDDLAQYKDEMIAKYRIVKG